VVVDKLVVEIVGGATDVVGVKDVNRVDDNDDDDDEDEVDDVVEVSTGVVELDIVNRSNTSFPAYFVKFSWYFMIRPAAAILLEK
jgi:Ran GTPase-activating protein (RanGAP) involved in mRNA processing and transport